MTPAQFRAALDRLGLSQVGAAKLFGYSDGRVVRRYISGERAVPAPLAILLRLMIAGKISAADVEAARG